MRTTAYSVTRREINYENMATENTKEEKPCRSYIVHSQVNNEFKKCEMYNSTQLMQTTKAF